MKFAIENRRGVKLAAGLLAFVVGMPEILQAQEPALGTGGAAQSAQVAGGNEPSGSSEDPGSTEENRRRGWCGYYYPCYHYYYQPVYYPVVTYPVVTYPVVTYPVATYPTFTIPTYGPYGVLFNGKSGSNGGETAASDQVANELKSR